MPKVHIYYRRVNEIFGFVRHLFLPPLLVYPSFCNHWDKEREIWRIQLNDQFPLRTSATRKVSQF